MSWRHYDCISICIDGTNLNGLQDFSLNLTRQEKMRLLTWLSFHYIPSCLYFAIDFVSICIFILCQHANNISKLCRTTFQRNFLWRVSGQFEHFLCSKPLQKQRSLNKIIPKQFAMPRPTAYRPDGIIVSTRDLASGGMYWRTWTDEIFVTFSRTPTCQCQMVGTTPNSNWKLREGYCALPYSALWSLMP